MDEQNSNERPAAENAGVTQPMGAEQAAPEPTQPTPTDGAPGAAAQHPTTEPLGATTQQPMPAQPPVGQPVGNYTPAPAKQPSPTGALVCGILAIVLCFIPIIGIILGIVAIVLAGSYFKAGGTQGQGKAGRICGIIGIVLSGVMIIVNCILVFAALEALDDYTPSSNYALTSSASSAAAGDQELTAEEEELFAVTNPDMEKLKNQDPEMVAMVAEVLEESLNEELESQDISLATLGVDPTELAKSMLQGFDYAPEDAYSYNTEGSVSYTITVKDVYEVSMTFYNKVTSMMDDISQYGSVDEAYKLMGQALMEAANETAPEADTYFPAIDIIKSGDSWSVDPDSWEYSIEYIFEF